MENDHKFELDAWEDTTRMGNGFVKETKWIQHPETKHNYLYYVRYKKQSKSGLLFNDYLDQPGYIKYYFLSDKVKSIMHFNNNCYSNMNGPAVINYDLDGNISSQKYFFDKKEFASKYDLDKYIKKLNLT